MINHKTQRFYWLRLVEDLLGCWHVQKIYGGLNKENHSIVYDLHHDKISASQAMYDLEIAHLRRGYKYADTLTPEDYTLTPEVI